MGKSENVRDRKAPKKARKRHTQWTVPVRVEYETHATVEAADMGEAIAKASAGDFEVAMECAELVNWKIQGNPTEDA